MMQNIPSLQYGDLVIDLHSRTVALHGREITVTLKEFEVLHFMVRHAGWAMTKEQIYNAVWEDEMVNGGWPVPRWRAGRSYQGIPEHERLPAAIVA